MKTDRNSALRELRALVATYLEGSDDAGRAVELLDALDVQPPQTVVAASDETDSARWKREGRERSMFGCTAAAIDGALSGREPRDIAMYAMGTLSNAQELIRGNAYDGDVEYTVTDRDANTIRQLMNIAKYAIDKAVPRD
jgi:hypothetical protein